MREQNHTASQIITVIASVAVSAMVTLGISHWYYNGMVTEDARAAAEDVAWKAVAENIVQMIDANEAMRQDLAMFELRLKAIELDRLGETNEEAKRLDEQRLELDQSLKEIMRDLDSLDNE